MNFGPGSSERIMLDRINFMNEKGSDDPWNGHVLRMMKRAQMKEVMNANIK